jgi:hypothetical protein
MNLLSVSYGKICSVMHQLCNREVNEKHVFHTVNYFSLKLSVFKKWNNCTFLCLMLCYFTFLCLVDLILICTLCTVVDFKRFYVFKLDHWVQKSGHLWANLIYHICLSVCLSIRMYGSTSWSHIKGRRAVGVLTAGCWDSHMWLKDGWSNRILETIQ